MGFLKKFFRDVLEEAARRPVGSFEHLSEEELETHLGVARYNGFSLTDAIRPSYDLKVTPQQGYRHDFYTDEQAGTRVPVVMASATREILFDLFMDMLDPLGTNVDVVLETSHHRDAAGHADLYREHIDLPVLKSILYDHEELLTHDGCAGIAVLNPAIPQEVQFDEHKLIIVYGAGLTPYESILTEYGISLDEQMRFITEAEHVHSSSEEYAAEFEGLKMRLGMDADYC